MTHVADLGALGDVPAQHFNSVSQGFLATRLNVLRKIRYLGFNMATRKNTVDAKTRGFSTVDGAWLAAHAPDPDGITRDAALWAHAVPATTQPPAGPNTASASPYRATTHVSQDTTALPDFTQNSTKDGWVDDSGIVPQPVAPPSGDLPGGVPGIALPLTVWTRQDTAFVPAGNVLIDPWHGGPATDKYGTIVWDVTPQGNLDKNRRSRIQSAWRTYRLPKTGLIPFGAPPDTKPGQPPSKLMPSGIAWQLGLDIGGQAGWGMVAETPDGEVGDTTQALAAMGRLAGGPVNAGGGGCPHVLGQNDDGETVRSAHHDELTLIRGATGDAPFEFDPTPYIEPTKQGPFYFKVWCRNDLRDNHPWIPDGNKPGKRKWETTGYFDQPPPPHRDPRSNPDDEATSIPATESVTIPGSYGATAGETSTQPGESALSSPGEATSAPGEQTTSPGESVLTTGPNETLTPGIPGTGPGTVPNSPGATGIPPYGSTPGPATGIPSTPGLTLGGFLGGLVLGPLSPLIDPSETVGGFVSGVLGGLGGTLSDPNAPAAPGGPSDTPLPVSPGAPAGSSPPPSLTPAETGAPSPPGGATGPTGPQPGSSGIPGLGATGSREQTGTPLGLTFGPTGVHLEPLDPFPPISQLPSFSNPFTTPGYKGPQPDPYEGFPPGGLTAPLPPEETFGTTLPFGFNFLTPPGPAGNPLAATGNSVLNSPRPFVRTPLAMGSPTILAYPPSLVGTDLAVTSGPLSHADEAQYNATPVAGQLASFGSQAGGQTLFDSPGGGRWRGGSSLRGGFVTLPSNVSQVDWQLGSPLPTDIPDTYNIAGTRAAQTGWANNLTLGGLPADGYTTGLGSNTTWSQDWSDSNGHQGEAGVGALPSAVFIDSGQSPVDPPPRYQIWGGQAVTVNDTTNGQAAKGAIVLADGTNTAPGTNWLAPGTSGYVLTSNGAGAYPSYEPAGGTSSTGLAGLAGDGSDGAVTISASGAPLSADVFYSTLSVTSSSTMTTQGWRLFAKTSVTVASGCAIANNGQLGSPGTFGGSAGSGGSSSTQNTIGFFGGSAGLGGNGGVGDNGSAANTTSVTGSLGGAGGAGGSVTAGGTGGAAGSVITLPASTGGFRYSTALILGTVSGSLGNINPIKGGSGGPGGGSGISARGGGGGGAGGYLLVVSPSIVNNATGGLACKGGNAGAASAAGGSGGGGGAGGGGGVVALVGNVTGSGTTSVAGGAGGAGSGTGSAGTGGGTGTAISVPA